MRATIHLNRRTRDLKILGRAGEPILVLHLSDEQITALDADKCLKGILLSGEPTDREEARRLLDQYEDRF